MKKGLKKTRLINSADIVLPTLSLDGFVLTNIFLKHSDFNVLARNKACKAKYLEEIVQPNGIPFGIRGEQLSSYCRKPDIIINNEENIGGHKINLLRRKVGGVAIASQFHFIADKLFLVADEFNVLQKPLKINFKHMINGYYHLIPGLNGNNQEAQLYMDKKGNVLNLKIDFDIQMIYLNPNIWEKHITE
jgi:hypothetical protein